MIQQIAEQPPESRALSRSSCCPVCPVLTAAQMQCNAIDRAEHKAAAAAPPTVEYSSVVRSATWRFD